jgi:hypothetical protein
MYKGNIMLISLSAREIYEAGKWDIFAQVHEETTDYQNIAPDHHYSFDTDEHP